MASKSFAFRNIHIDARNHPLLIHCAKGKVRSVVAVLDGVYLSIEYRIADTGFSFLFLPLVTI